MGGMAIAGIGSALGGIASGVGGFMGSSAQAGASQQASALQYLLQQQALAQQQAQYQQTRADFAPYRDLGSQAAGSLSSNLNALTAPITMDQSTLENTPGYQWNLSQGLKSTQSSAAARGLGVSGAALKGASTYATGLADSTYQNQFNNANTNQTNAYNRLYQTTALGENAAAQQGTLGQMNANAQSSAYTGMGNAGAAEALGSAAATASGYNALTGAFSNGVNSLTSYYGLNSLINASKPATSMYDPLQGYDMSKDDGGYV